MIDFHSHTKASDGEFSPQELTNLAIQKHMTAIAITDHDTVDGLEEAEEYAKDKDIMLIPGIELEAKVEKGQMHILGLFIDYNNKEFKDKLNAIREYRNSRNDKFIEEFNRIGFEISLEELIKESNGKTIGKPHFARIFLQKGYVQTKDEMFDKYFNQEPFNKFKKSFYTPEEVITMIKKVNGIAILAHPQSLKLEDNELIDKIKKLKGYGLDGMECYHTKQTEEEMMRFNEIAKEYNLLITKGSDFHGPIIKPETQLGTGKNNNIVIYEEDKMLEDILKYRETMWLKNSIH